MKPTLYINHSTLKAFRMCPQFSFLKLYNWQSGASTAALTTGTAVHKALEVFYTTGKKEWPPELNDIMNHYFLVYPDDYPNVIGAEAKFEMPIAPNIMYRGTIDLITEEDGIVSIWDHKTSSNVPKYVTPIADTSKQLTGYLALANYNGIKTNKIIINGIGTRNPYASRFYSERSQAELDNWLADAIYWSQRFYDLITADYHNLPSVYGESPCDNQYFRPCEFRDYCSLSPKNRKTFLDNNFEQDVEYIGAEIEWPADLAKPPVVKKQPQKEGKKK